MDPKIACCNLDGHMGLTDPCPELPGTGPQITCHNLMMPLDTRGICKNLFLCIPLAGLHNAD